MLKGDLVESGIARRSCAHTLHRVGGAGEQVSSTTFNQRTVLLPESFIKYPPLTCVQTHRELRWIQEHHLLIESKLKTPSSFGRWGWVQEGFLERSLITFNKREMERKIKQVGKSSGKSWKWTCWSACRKQHCILYFSQKLEKSQKCLAY